MLLRDKPRFPIAVILDIKKRQFVQVIAGLVSPLVDKVTVEPKYHEEIKQQANNIAAKQHLGMGTKSILHGSGWEGVGERAG